MTCVSLVLQSKFSWPIFGYMLAFFFFSFSIQPRNACVCVWFSSRKHSWCLLLACFLVRKKRKARFCVRLTSCIADTLPVFLFFIFHFPFLFLFLFFSLGGHLLFTCCAAHNNILVSCTSHLDPVLCRRCSSWHRDTADEKNHTALDNKNKQCTG